MYKEMMDSIGMIQSIDPELGSAMNEELHRQRCLLYTSPSPRDRG